MSNNQHSQKLGDILLKGKLIDNEQLTIAKREHQIIGGKFGSIITSLSYTTEKSIIFFLYRKIFVKKKHRDINAELEKMLGELLISYRIISIKNLDDVLDFQKENNIKLGYALSELNIIDEKSLLDALKNQIFNTEEHFTGKGGKSEVIEDLTENKTHISIYVPIFSLLFLAIILLPTWYYFSSNKASTRDTTEAVLVQKETDNDSQTIKDEIFKIENELRFALSLKDNKSTTDDTDNTTEINQTEKDKSEELVLQQKENNNLNKQPIKTASIETDIEPLISSQNEQPNNTFDDSLDVAFMNSNGESVDQEPTPPNSIQIENVRYFSDGKIAKFVFDSKEDLKNSFIRSYLDNQNMKFVFNNSRFNSITIKDGHADKLIENFSIQKVNKSAGFIMRYRMKHAGSSLYHVLKPNKQNPLYRLAIVVRPNK